MGARAGGGAGRSGAKGTVTGYFKNTKANQVGTMAGKAYSVSYKQNGKKGEQMANFMTKKGADTFVKAMKNGNGVQWSLGVANKVDSQAKASIQKGQFSKAHPTHLTWKPSVTWNGTGKS